MDRADIVHENFLRRVSQRDLPVHSTKLSDSGLTRELAIELFHAQVISRHLDRHSRKLQARGEAFYTIGSSGHEGNAAIAAAFRPDDLAFLHYRDAAFQIARSRQVPGQTPIWDMLLSFTSSSDDPISGGRHKVLGSRTLNIPPQTSTIASHLPKAVGAAYATGLSRRLDIAGANWPRNAVVICSFGDASLNHSTAQGALNTAGWTAYQKVPLPLVFVCEDNGIGISTKTPAGWVAASMATRPGLKYLRCNGLDLAETFAAARQAATWARDQGRPVFLHMTCVRLYGHAGPDAQASYLSKEEIDTMEANDPLLHTAGRLIAECALTPGDVIDIYQSTDRQIARVAEEAILRPKLRTAAEIMESIIPGARRHLLTNGPEPSARARLFGEADMRAMAQPQHMAKLINFAMTDLMMEHGEIVMAGEDIGKKGGVYGVTQKIQARFGANRVIDTLLDEQAILGLAIGLGQNGFIAMPEIQFLAYLHNAEDQIRGEAATLSFFSNRQYTNPMVVRIAGLGYQRGFGGHFHNDNSIAVLRDIPGVIVGCPSNGREAALMLRECVRLAREDNRVVIFLEPIALYMTRDLHEPGDGGWTFLYPAPGSQEPIQFGHVAIHHEIGEGRNGELAIVTYGNGYYLSRQASRKLCEDHGMNAKVIDLRWLAPLPESAILEAVDGCANILIVDECRRSGSPSEALMALFIEKGFANVSRVTAEDSFIATGPAYAATLPSRDGIIEAAIHLVKDRSPLWAKG